MNAQTNKYYLANKDTFYFWGKDTILQKQIMAVVETGKRLNIDSVFDGKIKLSNSLWDLVHGSRYLFLLDTSSMVESEWQKLAPFTGSSHLFVGPAPQK